MASGAAEGFFRYLYDGCLSGADTGIERRPYHRNCRCALHNKSKESCPHGMPKSKNVSYPIRRSWSEGCLALALGSAPASCQSSPSSSPSLQIGRSTQQFGLYSNGDEQLHLSRSSSSSKI
ncbi:uncharacterized protein LOC110600516 [Manihot esculenta]|uniref:Uncharacterized protein n=1 Tax=Manihot esculenta TaxID=3983 RepID=A0A2C9UL65_MANES|nr:uncharacterized protein LOC110600516 [Manihot esculenta]OAY31777.1 hypothetical protein MANES_14G139400v8 [Manihot esculenta]